MLLLPEYNDQAVINGMNVKMVHFGSTGLVPPSAPFRASFRPSRLRRIGEQGRVQSMSELNNICTCISRSLIYEKHTQY